MNSNSIEDSHIPTRRKGPKGKRGIYSPEEVRELLRDIYVVLERFGKPDLVKRTLAMARSAGATFDDKRAVEYLRKFVAAHHDVRRTSPHGTNGLLNTTNANTSVSTGANTPDFEHETRGFSEGKHAGAKNNTPEAHVLNTPDFEHETRGFSEGKHAGKNHGYTPVDLDTPRVRSSRSAVETVDNGDKFVPLNIGSVKDGIEMLNKLEKNFH